MPVSTCEYSWALRKNKNSSARPTILGMLETTPARVGAPSAPSSVDEPIPDEDLAWEPGALPRAVRSRRTFRFSVILAVLALGAGAYLGIQFVLELPQAQAEVRRADYREALETVEQAVPDLRVAAAAITDPGSTDDLAPHLVTLVRLDGRSADLQASAEAPLPLILPIIPTGETDLLAPIQDRMRSIADRILTIDDLLGDIVAYRRAFAGAFLLPELPQPTDGPSVEVFADRLAEMTAATVEAALMLPDIVFLVEHRAGVNDLIAWLPEWQAAYLNALRDGDMELAGTLHREAADRVDGLRSDLSGSLEAAATWMSKAIDDLERDIETALILAV